MKRETTPTSPKYRKRENKPGHGRWPFITVILSIVFGFLAGFFGQLISLNYPLSWPYAQEIVRSGEDIDQDNIVLIKESSFSDHADLVQHLIEQSKSFLFSVYQADQYLGSALALTNDGWLVTSAELNSELELNLINKDSKEYSSQQIVSDTWSGLTFIKIDAQNLSVAEFASADQLGQELLVYYQTPSQENLSFNYLKNKDYYTQELRSSDSYQQRYLLNQPLADDFYSSPLINLNGKVIGFADQGDQIIPTKVVNNLLSQIISSGETKEYELGLNYYDLSYSFNQSELSDKGALISQLSEIIPGLRLKDIILKVGDQEIDQDHDFSTLLKKAASQEELKVTILRDGQEQEITLDL